MNSWLFLRTFFYRELVTQKTYSLQVILSVMIGVGAVSGIQSYKTSLTEMIQKEAKNLMGADLAFQTPEKIRPFQLELLESTLPKGSKQAQVIQFLSMLQSVKNGESALSMVRAMDPLYPFYGSVETDPPGIYENLDPEGILLDSLLAKNLSLQIGDKVQLGDKVFFFRGVLLKEPGSLGGFIGMAPASVVRRTSLEKSGLEQRGSRIRYTIYAKFPETEDLLQFKERNFDRYLENDLTIFHNTESNSGSQLFITNTLDFLSLLGLGSFYLGGIAIFISMRTRVINSRQQIAILKCLGLRSFQIRLLVLSETILLSLLGIILGLILGYYLQAKLPVLLPGVDGLEGKGLEGSAIIQSIGLGFLVPFLVSFQSLVNAGRIPPMDALKNPEGIAPDEYNLNRKFDWNEIGILVFVFFLFVTVAVLDTGSFFKGIFLCSIFFVIPGLVWFLYLVIRYWIGIVSRLFELPASFTLVLKKFVRQYSFTSLSVIGMGSAIFVLILSLILRESLLNLGGARQITKRPNVFVLDIRNDQRELFHNIVTSKNVQEYRISPVYRARLEKINGIKVDPTGEKKNASERDWRSQARTREYMLSYRDELYDTEKVTSGRFWNLQSQNEISVEKDFAKYLKAGIGDELEFRLEGFPMDRIRGKITNLRTVNWSDMKPNFLVLFSRGDLEKFPGFYLSSFYLESDNERYLLQKELVQRFPNLTFIDTEKAVKSFESVIAKVASIINVMSTLLIIASILLLISVLYSSSRERFQELVFYRIIGARKSFVRSVVLIEGALTGLFAFVVGLGLALIADFILNFFLLDLESVYPELDILTVMLAVNLGVTGAYYFTSSRLFHLPVKRLMKV